MGAERGFEWTKFHLLCYPSISKLLLECTHVSNFAFTWKESLKRLMNFIGIELVKNRKLNARTLPLFSTILSGN